MVRRKRLSSNSDDAGPSTKRQHTENLVIDVDAEDGDESLDSILAQIKAQEESEALAKRLQDEWDQSSDSAGPSNVPNSNEPDGVECIEDDEAMARRLAAEWDAADAIPAVLDPPGPSSTASNKGKAPETDLTADQVLRCHKDTFTAPRVCQCGKLVSSPRGHVRVLPLSPVQA